MIRSTNNTPGIGIARQFGCVCCVLVFVGTAVLGCKPVSRAQVTAGMAARPVKPAETIPLLKERKKQIEQWAVRCGASVSKENCGVGDAALFNGLMCLSGDELSCEAVRRSQGSDGRIWRAEFRVAADAVNSFSRDMAVGVLAYLVETRDRALASRWMAWIESNELRLCRESSDNRCDFTPGFWMLFRDVWAYLGLQPNAPMQNAVLEDSVVALMQARFAPAGFQMHLSGVNALIRKRMGQSTATLNSLTESLLDRQPLNPFFAYLALGADQSVVDRTLAWCPVSKPADRTQWSFERDQNERAWLQSMGWECVMLLNLLLADLTPEPSSEKP